MRSNANSNKREEKENHTELDLRLIMITPPLATPSIPVPNASPSTALRHLMSALVCGDTFIIIRVNNANQLHTLPCTSRLRAAISATACFLVQ